MKKLLTFVLLSSYLLISVGCNAIDLSTNNSSSDTSQTTDNHATTNTTNNGVDFNTTNNTDVNGTVIPRLVLSKDVNITCDLTGSDDFVYIDGIVSNTFYKVPFNAYVNNESSEIMVYDSYLYYKISDIIVVEDNPTSVSLDIKVVVKDNNDKVLATKICFQPSLL